MRLSPSYLGITIVVVLVVFWLGVRWLEPRMAFFPSSGVQATPAAARIPFTDLKITTEDGVTLHGWWMPHDAPRGQVVYWHGNGGNLSLWLPVLGDLYRRGFDVMAVDYRGYGASEGRPSERGLYLDATAATSYFMTKLRKPGVPVVFWGRSLGCSVASFAAAQAPPSALVLESPFPDVRTLFKSNPLMLGLSVFSSYRFATSAHLERYAGPLLVLHGDADSIIPFSAGRAVFDRAATPQKVFAALPGADHNDVHASHPGYWPAIDRFLTSITPR